MDDGEKKKVKKDHFKNRGCGEKNGRIGDGSQESHPLKEDEGDPVIDMNQQGGEGIEEKGKEGGNEAEGDNEKAHPGNDEEVGEKSNRGETVEMMGNQRGSPQNSHSGDEKGEENIFQDIFLPRGVWKNKDSLLFQVLEDAWH
jgi:hypothetical protein